MSSIKVNPHRPYYTPGLHHQHNYTSLPSNDSSPVLVFDADIEQHQLKSLTARCISFASFKYFVTMLTSPLEVGTTLLQVQYSPHQDVEVVGIPQHDHNTSSSLSSSVKIYCIFCLYIYIYIYIKLFYLIDSSF
jgi:fusion and transport protein UGO1